MESLGRLDTMKEAAILKKEAVSPLREPYGNSITMKNKTMKCEKNEKSGFEITFVCLKFGTKYSAEYVNNLYLALVKNTADYYGKAKGDTDRDGDRERVGARGRFRFVCYTENADELCAGVEVHPLPVEPLEEAPSSAGSAADTHTNHTLPSTVLSSSVTAEERHRRALIGGMKGWKGWWYKAYLFHAVESLNSPDKDKDSHTSSQGNSETADSQHCKIEEGIGIGIGIEGGEENHNAKRWICYFDLDTVLGGSLDFLFQLLATETGTHTETGTETEIEMKEEIKFYTLGAAHFPCEGRPCGINSSVMIWQPGCDRCSGSDSGRDRGRSSRCSEEGHVRELYCSINSTSDSSNNSSDHFSGEELGDKDAVCDGDRGDQESIDVFDAVTGGSSFQNIFFYLFRHYEAVTKCVYKFDHYLEMLLLSSAHTAPPTEHHPSHRTASNTQGAERAVRVVYLQDLPDFEGKIIDFSSLFTAASHAEEAKEKNSEATSSCRDTGERHALCSSCPTATPNPTLVCDSTLTPSDPNPNMTSTSTLSRPSFCEDNNSDRDIKSESKRDMDMDTLRCARVICFPLIPKPHQAAKSFPLIQLMWTGQCG
jgi:hypothetical protein